MNGDSFDMMLAAMKAGARWRWNTEASPTLSLQLTAAADYIRIVRGDARRGTWFGMGVTEAEDSMMRLRDLAEDMADPSLRASAPQEWGEG